MKSCFILCFSLIISLSALAKNVGSISSYDENYLLGVRTDNLSSQLYMDANFHGADQLNYNEIKYQFSLAVPIIRLQPTTAIVAAYTQLSYWQLGNNEISSPFRETNYKPQLFLQYQAPMLLINNVELGVIHESNGQSAELSRSWDRGYIGLERIGTQLEFGLHLWSILGNPSENEDIADYYAPYKVWLEVETVVGELSTSGYYNFDTDRGGVELGYSFPLNDFIGFYVQVYHGYGESLIEYNLRHTRVGAGIKLMAWD